MDNEDYKSETIMYFEQIIDLLELMIENGNYSNKNMVTLVELAENEKSKLEQIKL